MECLFKEEIAAGNFCCDFGGQCHEPSAEQCPTAIFNLCQSCGADHDPIPETLTWCRSHYVPPVQKYITCQDFGYSDGMSGGCWWCMEMTPYQWHMCQDASWIRSLTNPSRTKVYTKAKAIKFIENRKQSYPMGNERKAILSESDK